MSVSNVRDADVFGAIVRKGWKLASLALDAGAGTLTCPSDPPPVLLVDAGGGAANFDMPAEADVADTAFWVVNTADAVETLTVRDDGAGTIIALAQNESALIYCDGTSWYVLQGASV